MISFLFIANRILSTMVKQGPRPIVICGPSGSGKSTLLKKLFEEFPNTFGFCVSHTTRKPRPKEQDGVDYIFVSHDDMKASIAKGEFIETATFSGNMYGTSKQAVYRIQEVGKVCILDIEPNGVEQVKQTELNPILIYNNPPSIQALEERLRKRNTETEESLKKRLHAAEDEIAYGLTPGNFHKIIENIEIEQAYKEFREFIINELKAQEALGVTISW